MIQNWFGTNSFKIDVTVSLNVVKNDSKTHSWLIVGFLVIFCDICSSCDINFEAIGPKSILDHNSVNS